MANQKNTLAEIQSEVKAPKGQFNSFGKYKYRSAEDILEAIKPIINPKGFSIILSDEIISMDGRFYIKATATLTNGIETYSATGFAREEESKKGMDGSQVTGASSSYSRKYALNGLFALDDTKDSDTTNTHGNAKAEDHPKQEDVLKKWNSAIASINTLQALQEFYFENEKTIMATPEIIQMVTLRKNQLTPKQEENAGN